MDREIVLDAQNNRSGGVCEALGDVLQYPLTGDAFQADNASCWQAGEIVLKLVSQAGGAVCDHRSKSGGKPIFAPVCRNEIQHSEALLAFEFTQSTP